MASKKEIVVIPPAERAAQAMSVAGTKEQLAEMAKASADLVAVTDQDSRKLVHDSYMVLKNTRISIEKAGKAGREDATAYSKAVIEIEKGLIAVIEPEEARLKKLRDDFDNIEAARLAEIAERERQRVAAVEHDIAVMRDAPLMVIGEPAFAIQEKIEWLQAQDSDTFEGEYLDKARAAKAQSMAQLKSMFDAALAAERAAAEQAERQAELDRRQAEIDKADREAREKREAEDRAAQAERDRLAEIDRKAAKERQDELDRQAQALQAERDEAARVLREKAEAEAAEEAKRQLEEDERLLAELAKAEAEEIASADLREAIQDAASYIRNTAGVDSKVYKKLVAAAGRHFNEEIV